jgi:prepilin-type N-terminal cleavage/methylation domain-containing protein
MRVVESQKRRVKSQKRLLALRSFSGSRPSTLDPRPFRRGVTLIELLIVILIISLLAALVLGVASVAGETAREQHSRHVVERLHTLLIDYYNTYKTRRARLNPNVEKEVLLELGSGPKVGLALAEARLYAMREMMLMDIPDRWSDVLLQRIEDFTPSKVVQPLYLSERTQLSNVYLRRFQQLLGRTNDLTGAVNTPEEIRRNQGAECLYMVIMTATGDGEARTLFGENCIGDSDGDGAPEFVDGWKHPINFLRWAPGYISQIQLDMTTLSTKSATASTEISKDHDPFDMFRVDPAAFRLVPLIYSPGRNEDSGIHVATDYVTWTKAPQFDVNNKPNPGYLEPRLTPYELDPAGKLTSYLGTSVHVIDPSLDETSTDNITNHLLGLR